MLRCIRDGTPNIPNHWILKVMVSEMVTDIWYKLKNLCQWPTRWDQCIYGTCNQSIFLLSGDVVYLYCPLRKYQNSYKIKLCGINQKTKLLEFRILKPYSLSSLLLPMSHFSTHELDLKKVMHQKEPQKR